MLEQNSRSVFPTERIKNQAEQPRIRFGKLTRQWAIRLKRHKRNGKLRFHNISFFSAVPLPEAACCEQLSAIFAGTRRKLQALAG